ncbi:MAG: hypothetical protein AAGJ37_14865 [Pseudomonadota bacterium]
MKTFGSRFFVVSTVLILLICFLLIGCSNNLAEGLRKVTYPPDFNYTSTTELRSEMSLLAQQMVLLEQALHENEGQESDNNEVRREQVVNILRDMGRIANRLKAGNAGVNHPFMDDYMQDFIAKVDQARGAASINPPRYFLAGKVAGACSACHKVNRD